MPCLKGLSYGKDESRGLSCGYRFSICQNVMKSDNLLHIRGFVDSLLQTTVLITGEFLMMRSSVLVRLLEGTTRRTRMIFLLKRSRDLKTDHVQNEHMNTELIMSLALK